jgi:hypothetical protein
MQIRRQFTHPSAIEGDAPHRLDDQPPAQYQSAKRPKRVVAIRATHANILLLQNRRGDLRKIFWSIKAPSRDARSR